MTTCHRVLYKGWRDWTSRTIIDFSVSGRAVPHITDRHLILYSLYVQFHFQKCFPPPPSNQISPLLFIPFYYTLVCSLHITESNKWLARKCNEVRNHLQSSKNVTDLIEVCFRLDIFICISTPGIKKSI
jgi:hypothetical protein